MRERLNARKFKAILKYNNYELVSTKGDHFKYRNIYTHKTIVIPLELNPMVAKRLIKENNLERQDCIG